MTPSGTRADRESPLTDPTSATPSTADRLQSAAPWLLLVTIAWAMTGPIADPDFWWHLASGRWMWNHRALLHADPFGIPLGFAEPPLRSEFVLQQFWLAQLVYHWVHALAGARGAIVLRALLHGAMFALVYRRLRGRGASPLFASALLALAAQAIIAELGYVADRPQAWTSLFLIVLLDLLDRLFDGDRRWRWLLPPFMVLWANLHGGFIVGDGIIGVYALGRLGAFRKDWRPFAIAAAAVAASGLNPNAFDAGWQVLATMVDAPFTAYWASIVETQSIFSHASSFSGIARRLPALSALAAVGALGLAAHLARLRRIQLHFVLVALLAAVMGGRAIRFVAFFAVVAAEVGALGLAPHWLRAREIASGRLRVWLLPAASTLGVCAIAAWFALAGWRTTALASPRPYEHSLDPAVSFIRENGLTGRLFNEHNDGGFLINALEPGVRVFIDSRVLSVETFQLARVVVDAPEGTELAPGLPNWKAAFSLAGIDMVLLPGADRVTGTLLRLSELLLRDPEWEVVFADARTILFVSRTGRLGWFAKSRAIPRRLGYENMLLIAMANAGGGHGRGMPAWMLAAAVARAGLGEPGAALELVSGYLSLAPSDPLALSLRARLLGQR